MLQTQEYIIQCPYCGEMIEIVVDLSVARQDYIEDCSICCKPINLSIEIPAAGDATIRAASEHDC